MSNKYIIRNCPCYWHIGEDDGCSLDNIKQCEDDIDCVLKNIVEGLRQVAYACHCDNCDGCEYHSGCGGY